MPPDANSSPAVLSAAERARRLSRFLQARFRIDLFSALVERDFERRLAVAIAAAEQDAFRRGQEAALSRPASSLPGLAPPDLALADIGAVIPPRPTSSADGAGSRAA